MYHESSPFVHRRSRRRRVVAGLIALTLVAAACGGDDDDDDAADATSAGTAATDTAAADGTTAPTESAATTEPAGTSAPETSATETTGADERGDDVEYDLDATLVVTTDGRPQQLDPHLEPNTGNRGYTTAIYDTLTDTKDRSEVRPMLATEWETSDDGLTVTLQLRDDVTFHDGTPLDAEAVKASLDRAMTVEGSTQVNDMSAIESVEATGAVRGDDHPERAGPEAADRARRSGRDDPQPDRHRGRQRLLGQPRRLRRLRRGRARPRGERHLRAGRRRVLGSTWRQARRVHDVVRRRLPGRHQRRSFRRVRRLVDHRQQQPDPGRRWGDDLQVVDFIPTSIIGLYLVNAAEPLSDQRVRQAIAYSVDREGITNAIFDGGADCAPTSQNYPVPGDPLYVEGFDPYPYDPEQATALIEEAGAGGQTIEMYDIGTTASRDLGQALQPMLQAIGLDAQLVSGSTATVAELQARTIQSIVLTSVAMPHPLMSLTRYWLPGGAYHMAEGEDAELQTLMADAVDPAASEDEVAATYEAMAEEMADLALIMPVCAPVQHVLARSDIVGIDEAELSRLNMRYVGVAAEG